MMKKIFFYFYFNVFFFKSEDLKENENKNKENKKIINITNEDIPEILKKEIDILYPNFSKEKRQNICLLIYLLQIIILNNNFYKKDLKIYFEKNQYKNFLEEFHFLIYLFMSYIFYLKYKNINLLEQYNIRKLSEEQQIFVLCNILPYNSENLEFFSEIVLQQEKKNFISTKAFEENIENFLKNISFEEKIFNIEDLSNQGKPLGEKFFPKDIYPLEILLKKQGGYIVALAGKNGIFLIRKIEKKNFVSFEDYKLLLFLELKNNLLKIIINGQYEDEEYIYYINGKNIRETLDITLINILNEKE